MTREEAKKTLADTWCFERVGERISLRNVSLIGAVLSRELERPDAASSMTVYSDAQVPRSA